MSSPGDDITLAFAELKDPSGPSSADTRRSRVPGRPLFPTVGTAVTGYLKAPASPWTDWESRAAEAGGLSAVSAHLRAGADRGDDRGRIVCKSPMTA